MNFRMAIGIACVALVFTVITSAGRTRAQQYRLEQVLVGKWRQEFGPYVGESVYTAAHRFISVTIQRGAPYRLYVEGTWEIRNGNQLWTHNIRWVPDTVRMPEWEGTQVEVVNVNHLRNKLGDAYRVP